MHEKIQQLISMYRFCCRLHCENMNIYSIFVLFLPFLLFDDHSHCCKRLHWMVDFDTFDICILFNSSAIAAIGNDRLWFERNTY